MIPLLVVLVLVLSAPINCLGTVKLLYYSGPDVVFPDDLQTITLNEVNIDPSKQLKILCHGWKGSSSVGWYDPLIQAYLDKGHQVLAVDWEDDAEEGYFDATLVADETGQLIANKIIELIQYGIQFDKVHMIGHSLGAHIAGFTGKYVFASTNSKIGRITGLDPAGPLFVTALEDKRLCDDDAEFVDVIHTSALGGILIPIGGANFYPDGGSVQNSCIFDTDITCSHGIAPYYFIESVNSDDFVAKPRCSVIDILEYNKCREKPVAIMGEGCATSAYGIYDLSTNSQAPYGKGE